MSAQVTPAKRPHDSSVAEVSGKRKWQKSSALGSDNAPFLGSSSSKIVRLLCPASKIGGIIGKGGGTISQIRQETGAKVRVEETVPGCDERVIIIVGSDKDDEVVAQQVKAEVKEKKSSEPGENPEHLETDEKQAGMVDDPRSEKEKATSSIQKALLVVFDKMVDGLSETNEGDDENSKQSSSVVRLLVFSGQVGCLLGKAGSVIKQMSSESGAQIRILPKDKLPACASSSDELVQVTGEFEVVQEALLQITSRLRNHFFRDVFPPLGHPPNPAYLEQMPPFPSYMGMREFSPSRTFSHRGPPFNKFDGPGGLPPGGGFHPHDDHPPFAHDFPRPGIPPHMSERMSSAAPWGPQISDAKITITDPKPGATETVIIISGTPEQTNAAQSLIQAFVISETEAP
ncbi:UNVERIFIED_CONTAM: KH domain-containing protein HEN4 [Sesamum calycinum]|uniref:KH domain-containing protein HEN4 n=1 Tax=Sesamum calycinum TaxID=2727403 RepID=A0AAW2PB18_9LAMI